MYADDKMNPHNSTARPRYRRPDWQNYAHAPMHHCTTPAFRRHWWVHLGQVICLKFKNCWSHWSPKKHSTSIVGKRPITLFLSHAHTSSRPRIGIWIIERLSTVFCVGFLYGVRFACCSIRKLIAIWIKIIKHPMNQCLTRSLHHHSPGPERLTVSFWE